MRATGFGFFSTNKNPEFRQAALFFLRRMLRMIYSDFDRKRMKLFRFIFVLALICGAMSLTAAAQQVRLRAQITPDCGSSSTLKFADIYADGNIAVQGSYSCRGAFIYDISDVDHPVLASWYNPGGNIQFLEAVVVGNRGYFGSGNGSGVHIVDLTDPYHPQLLGVVDATHGNGHNSVHEIVIWNNILIENYNGFSNKILKFINVSNPANPVFLRDLNPTEPTWVHAMHIRGTKMFTSGWGSSSQRGRTEIYDIANVATQPPTLLGFIEDSSSITAGNSMHSSWTSEDGKYLYSCRETSDGKGDLRTYDISNPAQPVLVNRVGMSELNLNAVTPHNPVVMGNKLYVAWYQAGLQVFDLSNPAEPKRTGQYDTYQPQFNRIATDPLNDESWDMVCGTDRAQSLLPTNYAGDWAVFPFLGEDKILAGDLAGGLFVLDASASSSQPRNRVSDFDGDGKTDYSTFSPSSGFWNIEKSSNGAAQTAVFGSGGDQIVTGDYNGDGKSDIAVFRPSNGTWYTSTDSASNYGAVLFGVSGDVPVAGDYDADGKTDVAVFRPSNGTWYILQSMLGFRAVKWGQSGDKPLVGDFEGDGKTDIAVFRPSNGAWYILQSSSSSFFTLPNGAIPVFGFGTDKPLVGDFDGDGKTDISVYRPSDGFWYILKSGDNAVRAIQFGASDDLPIPADYDGDGKTDVAVYRPGNGFWYRLNSSDNNFVARSFGQIGDRPSPSSVQP